MLDQTRNRVLSLTILAIGSICLVLGVIDHTSHLDITGAILVAAGVIARAIQNR
jgi:hypothetical protein